MGNRNWVVAAVLVAAVVIVGLVFHGSKPTAGVGFPSVEFGPRVQPAASPALLDYTNGWVATAGIQAIGVYAGSDPSNRVDGLFVIVRTTHARQRTTRKLLRGSGAVTLLRPGSVKSEAAAYGATLRFVTASGNTGTLNLANNTVALNS